MLRLCLRPRRYYCFHLRRPFSSSDRPILPPNNVRNPQHTPSQLSPPPPSTILHQSQLPAVTTSSRSRNYILVASATVFSAIIASLAVLSSDNHHDNDRRSRESHNPSPLYAAIEQAIHKSNDSFRRIFFHIKQTGVAASVLWQSLRSVLSSANHEVRAGFELRVASLLADIAGANESRRSALVGAGGGAVLDWLLETVAVPRDGCGTQAESARALAYLIADPNVSSAVLGRPHAVPYLLRFIFSCQPQQSKKVSFVVFLLSSLLSDKNVRKLVMNPAI